MRDRKKRDIVIASLCCLLVFMGIGYAILSQTLNISGIANMKGNWNVKITNMELLEKNKTGKAEEVSHSFTDTTATFEANLYMPGDSIEYRVTVENQGNIDAVLKSITPTVTNKNVNIKFSHSTIDNTVLTAGKTILFTMKVEFLEDATTIPNIDSLKYSLELVYVQYNGGDYTPAVETTEESCFMISDDGTLISYDKNCGTENVVIPAKINNIPVKKVSGAFLNDSPFVAVLDDGNANTDDQTFAYIVKDTESKIRYVSKKLIGFYNMDELLEVYKTNNEEITEKEITEYKYYFDMLRNCIENNVCDNVDDSFVSGTVDKINQFVIYGSSEYNELKLMTIKKAFTSSSGYGNKIYKDSDGTIKYETHKATSEGANIYKGFLNYNNYCATTEACNLLKEYLKNNDPAKKQGITKETYYEYVSYYGAPKWYTLDEVENEIFDYSLVYWDAENSSALQYGTIDFSQAIYMETFDLSNNYDEKISAKKLVLPPNVEHSGLVTINVDEVLFPNNSKTKTIGFEGFKYTKNITIPNTVVSIGGLAFSQCGSRAQTGILEKIKFASNSNLISIYDDDYSGGYDHHGTFCRSKLTSVNIPKSVEYIDSNTFYENRLTSVTFESNSNLKYLDTSAFSGNSNLTQITLTTPTDLTGWTNGSTVNGITVVYER